MITELESSSVKTLADLLRIERFAMACERDVDQRALVPPLKFAWEYYVRVNHFRTELHRLTGMYTFSNELIAEAYTRVLNDPERNRSWNMVWLCLMKMKDDGLLTEYAANLVFKPEIFGGRERSAEEIAGLTIDYEYVWTDAVDFMLRNWEIPPMWSYRDYWTGRASRS